MSAVFRREFVAPEIDRREILRYLGCKEGNAEIDGLIDRAVGICSERFTYKLCYAEYELKIDGDVCDMTFAIVRSVDLAKCLKGCSRIILFAATVGLDIDRQILRYGRSEPSLAVAMQALGSERVEALCDEFCLSKKGEYAERGMRLRPRFSPGYGDLSLELQREIFAALGCERQIGVTLNDTLLMSPSKSVTAIIGIY